jgi:signal peptidase I
MTTARRPLLALTASLLLPGLGQVYNGEIYKGISLFALLALVPTAAAWLGVHGPAQAVAPMAVLGVLVALAIYLFSVIDAYRTAAALGESYTARPYNQGYAYVALFLCGYFFVLGPTVKQTKETLLEFFRVPSASMMPTLMPGDLFFADKTINRPGAASLWRGVVAIFVYPNNRSLIYVKRVIGLPGDHIEIKGTTVSVNGKSTAREAITDFGDKARNTLLADYVAVKEGDDSGGHVVLWKRNAVRAEFSLDVPAGHVFVLGDNRDAAQDSHHFGLVPLTDITGVARQILLAAGGGAIDWGRTGERIR